MKTMKRMLAMLLVLAMLISNLPVGALAAELETAPVEILTETEAPTEAVQETEVPTEEPTEAPTEEPTEAPAEEPTEAHTEEPTEAPTEEFTKVPTEEPTEAPTEEPTEAPTEEPTEAPTEEPTEAPTEEPTEAPTEEPTEAPTEEPTEAPTEEPTEAPTEEPTEAPTEQTEVPEETVEEETVETEDEAVLAADTTPYLSYRWLSLNSDGEWYEDEAATYNRSITMLPEEPSFYYAVFYLNTYDESTDSWNRTPVTMEQLSWISSFLVISNVSEDEKTGSNSDYYLELTPNSDAWSTEIHTISYTDDSDVSAIPYVLGMGEGACFVEQEYVEAKVISEYLCDLVKTEDAFFFRFESDEWTLKNVELDETNGASMATLKEIGENEYKITLDRSVVNVPKNSNGMLLQVNYTMESVADGHEETWSANVLCQAAEANDDYAYLSAAYLNAADGDNSWYLAENAVFGREIGILPLNSFHMVFMANVWNEETQVYDKTPVPVEELSYNSYVMSITHNLEDNHVGEYKDYFVEITPHLPQAWDTTTQISHQLDNGYIISMDCYLGRSPHELYVVDSYNGDTSVFNNNTVAKKISIDMNEGADNSFYYWFDSQGGRWTFGSVELNKAAGAGLATMECVDEANHVYKITPTEETVANAVTLGNFNISVDCTMYWTDSGQRFDSQTTMWYNPPILAVSKDPYLTVRWLNNDWDNTGWYEVEDAYLGTAGNVSAMNWSGLIFYLNTWNEETGSFDSVPVIPYEESDYLTIEKMVDLSDHPIREGQANAEQFTLVTAVNNLHHQDTCLYYDYNGQRLELPFVIYAKEVAFYTAPEASIENIINGANGNHHSLTAGAEENAVYLVLLRPELFSFESMNWETNTWGEDYNSFVSDGSFLDMTQVSDSVYKFTVDPEYVEYVRTNWKNFDLIANCQIRNKDDNSVDSWYTDIWIDPPEAGEEENNDSYLSARYLDNDGQGWYENTNNDATTDFGTMAMTANYMVFYWNQWDEASQQWTAVPVIPTENSEYLEIVKLADQEQEAILEGEPNADYFVMTQASGTLYHTEIDVIYEGTKAVFAIYEPAVHFYSDVEMSPDTLIWGNHSLDPKKEENAVYFSVLHQDFMHVENLKWEIHTWGQDYNAFVSDGEFLTIEEVTPGKLYKLTVDPEYVARLPYDYKNFNVAYSCDLYNDDGSYSHSASGDIWFQPPEQVAEIVAEFDINQYTYVFYADGTIGHYDYTQESIPWTEETLPQGVSYDASTNTLTLDNASLESLSIQHDWYDNETGYGNTNLPSDTLTINLVGENSIVASTNVTPVWFGSDTTPFTVTFGGSGSLYVKATNYNGQNSDGYYTVSSIENYNTSLVFGEEAKVTVEIAGQGKQTHWNGDTYLGEERAHLTAIRAFGESNSLTVRDSAVLTTVVPDGAMRNGTRVSAAEAIWGNEYPGGFSGIDGFLHVNIQGGTLNTQSLDIFSHFNEDSTIRMAGSYNQTGGVVNITGQGSYGETEQWNEETGEMVMDENGNPVMIDHYHYEGIHADPGARIFIENGNLNIHVQPTAAQAASSAWFRGIGAYGADIEIGRNSRVQVTGAYEGEGIRLGYHGDDAGNLIREGSLVINGGVLNVVSPDSFEWAVYTEDNTTVTVNDGGIGCGGGVHIMDTLNVNGGIIDLGWAIELDYNAVLNMNGGELHFAGGDGNPTLRSSGGEAFVNINGGTITLMDRAWDYGGNLFFDNAVMNATDSEVALGYNFYMVGGTINAENTDVYTFGMGTMYDGAINVTNGTFVSDAAGFHLGEPSPYDEEGNANEDYELYAGGNPTITVINHRTAEDAFLHHAFHNPNGYFNITSGGKLEIETTNVGAAMMNGGMIHMTGGDLQINADSTADWADANVQDDGGKPVTAGVHNQGSFQMEYDAGSTLTVNADLPFVANYNGLPIRLDDSYEPEEFYWDSYTGFMAGNTATLNGKSTALLIHAPVYIDGAEVTAVTEYSGEDRHSANAVMVIDLGEPMKVAENGEIREAGTPAILEITSGELTISAANSQAMLAPGFMLVDGEVYFYGGTVNIDAEAALRSVSTDGKGSNIYGAYTAVSNLTGKKVYLEEMQLEDSEGNLIDQYAYYFYEENEESRNNATKVTITGGYQEPENPDTQPFLSYTRLEDSDEGWYEVTDEWSERNGARYPGYDRFGVSAVDWVWHVYYLNTWNEETGSWDSRPVLVNAGEHLYRHVMDWFPDEYYIKEGQENAAYFTRIFAKESGWDKTTEVYYTMADGTKVSMDVEIKRYEAGFYTGPEMTNANWVQDYRMDPYENNTSFYFGFDSDGWTLQNVEVEANGFEGMYTMEAVAGNENMRKITIHPDYAYTNVGIQVRLKVTAVDQDGNANEWYPEIWCGCDYLDGGTELEINGQCYLFFDGKQQPLLNVCEGYSEELDCEIWRLILAELPAGVTFDLDSNQLTLENAKLESIHTWYENEERMNLLSDELIIEVIGENSIVSDSTTALGFYGGLNVVINGDGVLNLKAINDNNVDGEGNAYCFNTVHMDNGNLTLAGDVRVTAEIAGEGSYTVYDDNGNATGTEKSLLAVFSNNGRNALTLEDNAVLTTVMPAGAAMNGTPEEGYAGGYNNFFCFGQINVADNAQLNTQSLSLFLAFEEDMPVGTDFTQTGGTVNITSIPAYSMTAQYDENGRFLGNVDCQYYMGLLADAGNVTITGGTLNIDMMADLNVDMVVMGDALYMGHGDLTIENATVNVDYNVGIAISLGNWDIYPVDGEPPIHGNLYTNNAVINLNGQGDAEKTALYSEQPCNVSMTGGSLTISNADVELKGNTYLGNCDVVEQENGPTLYPNQVAGPEITVTGGTFALNSENKLVGVEMTLTNGSLAFDGMNHLVGSDITINDGWLETKAAGTILEDTRLTICNQKTQSNEHYAIEISPYTYFNVAPGAVIDVDATNWLGGILNNGGTFHLTGGAVDVKIDSTSDWSDYVDEEGVEWKYVTEGFTSLGAAMINDGSMTVNADAAMVVAPYFGDEENPYARLDEQMLFINGGDVTLKSHGFTGLYLAANAYVYGGTLTIQSENGDWGTDTGMLLTSQSGDYYYKDANGNTKVERNKTSEGVLNVEYDADISIECRDDDRLDEIAKGILIRDGQLNITGGTIDVKAEEVIDDYVGEDENAGTRITGSYLARSNNSGKVLLLQHVYVPEGGVGLAGYHYHFEEDNTPGSAETGFQSSTNITITGGANKCGDNAYWYLADGVLTISGTGAMYDFDLIYDEEANINYPDAPWYELRDTITSVVVEEGITYVGNAAFCQLNSMTTVSYPASLEDLGISTAFGASFTEYILDSANKVFRTDDGALVRKDTMTLVSVPCGKTGSYTLASDICVVGNGAFEGSRLTEVTLNDGLKKIGDGGFAVCPNLTELVIPETVTAIGAFAFNGCTGLKEITIPRSVTTIGNTDWDYETIVLDCPDILVKVYCESAALAYVENRNTHGITINYEVLHTPGEDGSCEYCGGIEAPVVTASNVASSGKIKLTWNKVEGAAKYYIYRATSKNGEYKYLTSTTNTSLTNTSAVAGSSYYYYVVAIAADGTRSEKSNIVSRTCDLPRPEISLSAIYASGKINVSWNEIEGAVSYKVYRSTSSSGTYSLLDTVEDLSYNDDSAVAGTTYYYKVIAVAEKSAANSAYSSVKYRTCDLARPVVTLSNVSSTGKIQAAWEAIDGAIGYEVYRSTSSNGTYTLLGTTEELSYVDNTAKAGSSYYYRVLALAEKSAANSAKSTAKSRTCDLPYPVASVTNVASTGHIRIEWAAVEDAVSYKIYQSTRKTGGYSLLASTDNLYYVDESAEMDETYYYRVLAVAEKSAANSGYSVPVSGYRILARPVVTLNSVASTGKINITWNEIESAVGYEIYRSESSSGTFELLDTTEELSYTDTSAEAAKTYYYKVLAVAEDADANSVLSAVKYRTCDLPRPTVTLTGIAETGKTKVSWKSIDGAIGYKVYRSTSKSSGYELLSNTEELSYVDNSAEAGVYYYYKVMALAAKSAANSDYSVVKSRTCDLPRPVISLSNNTTTGYVLVEWAEVDGAVGYKVYKATESHGDYSLLATTEDLSYEDITGVTGEIGYYKVFAVAENTAANSAYSEEQALMCILARPVITLSGVSSTGKIKIAWEAVEGAVGYMLYRSTSKNGTYSLLAETETTSYTDNTARAGTAYYYKLIAVAESPEANSVESVSKYRTCDLARPTISLTGVASTGKTKISWNAIEGAISYKVYRSATSNGTYKLLETVTDTSYVDYSAEAGDVFYYKVMAVASNSAANSAYSSAKYRTCDLPRPVVSIDRSSSGKPWLSWEAVENAVSYKIYRATSKNGSYTLMYTTTNTSYTNTSAVSGKTYYYKVVAVAENTAANSAYSEVVSITAK